MLSHSLLFTVTDFGDSAVTLVVMAAAMTYLLLCRVPKAALALLFVALAAAGGIAIVKVLFLGCGSRLGLAGVHSPSGHAALSAAIYLTCGLLLAHHRQGWKRALPLVASAVLVLAIAASRVPLGAHSPAEVVIGLAVGLSAVWMGWVLFLRGAEMPKFHFWKFGLLLAVSALALHGTRLPAEQLIHRIAAQVGIYARFCNAS